MSSERVLILGSGGREHAIASKLALSPTLEHIYVCPGNAGTQTSHSKVSNIDLPIKDHSVIISWCQEKSISLVVVGPEDPLANGIQNDLSRAGIACFGPSKEAAQIEASKEFAKCFMQRHNIATARWKAFSNPNEACQFIESAPFKALVIKVDGLAAGKGVTVAKDIGEAKSTVHALFSKTNGCLKIVVEELLIGQEVSVLCFSDGNKIKAMPPSQDYKRLNDNDEGPNTGGMGAYCPCPWVSENQLKNIEANVLQKVVDGLNSEGIVYKGVLYAGLMITEDGPKVLEFNCRFGDPETQVILPLMKSDLYSVMKSCVDGNLSPSNVTWNKDQYSVAVVLVSSGYPGSYAKHKPVTGLDEVVAEKHIQVIHAGTALNDNIITTSGGRVLAVIASTSSLQQSIHFTQQAAKIIDFHGKFYRFDIGKYANHSKVSNGLTYASSGVDIASGNELVTRIKSLTDKTKVKGVMGSIGGFGALFDLTTAGYDNGNTILVSGTDGVGTKLLIAQQLGKHDTIGIDLVAMCANDVLCQGAQPLYFLDYFACGKLDVQVAKSVVEGISHGCMLAQCALIGGETAEMPGMYPEHKYDLAGFCVGAVDKNQLLPRQQLIHGGDSIIGIASSGLHSNGFSLVRKILEKTGASFNDLVDGQVLGETLLMPTKIYSKLLPIIRKSKAFIHITGGGLIENIPRVLPNRIGASIDGTLLPIPSIFHWLASKGNVSDHEMLRTFNCGIGAVLIVEKSEEDKILAQLCEMNEKALKIGNLQNIKPGQDAVEILDCGKLFKRSNTESLTDKGHKKVGVLISGSGTNLQALINASNQDKCSYEIKLVISNKSGVEGLNRAQKAAIKTQVISHRDFKKREDFDSAIHEALIAEEIEYVCLAGFMRILSEWFVNKWSGRLLNTHPSLLPSFKGMHATRQALEAGVTISGCSVHFVSEELDGGAIITQEAVSVLSDDDETSLQERIKQSEHVAYPRALNLLTSDAIALSDDGKLKRLK